MPLTSFVAVYAVVAAVNDALFVYSASLKVWPVEAVKSCTARKTSALNDVQRKLPVNAIL